MPSPFPGMNPYLEGPSWLDFHARFIVHWSEALNAALPRGYWAGIDERINLVEITENSRVRRPDVAVVHSDEFAGTFGSVAAGGVAVLEPETMVTIPLPKYDIVRETWIEIIGRPDNTLIAVLELLSPFNKAMGIGRGQYLAKRGALISQSVHLVELDLLLGGERLPFARPLPPGDYFAMISRANRRPMCDVYPWMLPQPLPTIPIPLRPEDPDLKVDLGAVYAATYAGSRYEEGFDYSQTPLAPMSADALKWVSSRVVKQ